MSDNKYEQFENFIGEVVRVLLSDKRVLEGELSCMDKDLNFILNNSIEYHGVHHDEVDFLKLPEKIISRRIGMAMIPGHHVVKVLCRISE